MSIDDKVPEPEADAETKKLHTRRCMGYSGSIFKFKAHPYLDTKPDVYIDGKLSYDSCRKCQEAFEVEMGTG